MPTPLSTDEEVENARAELRRGDFTETQIEAFLAARSMAAGSSWNRKLAANLLRNGGFQAEAADVIANSIDLQRRR